MALIYPGALWRPMPGSATRPKRRKGRGVGFHIAVSERLSIYDINLSTGNDAHLYVRRDGGVEQNVDLDLVAYAGAAGNASMIWVETQGGTTATDVKSGRWTSAQAATLARIARWAHDTEGVPLQLMPDSKPASRGIGTHRLGIQHSLGIDRVAGWLVTGGERWSSAIGKECPGDARIAQLPSIISAALTAQEDTVSMDDVVHSWYDPRFRENRNYAQVIHNIEDQATAAATQLAGLTAAVSTLATAVAGGRDDLTAEELTAAVDEGIRRGGAAILAAQEAARAANPTS